MSNYRHGTNYYEILEVRREAQQNEIHKAYHRAKSTYSQDNPALYSMFSKEEARELVRMIEEAYSVLGNQALRKNYDQTLLADTTRQMSSTKIDDNVKQDVNSSDATKLEHHQLPDIKSPEAAPAATKKMNDEDFAMKKNKTQSSLPPGTGKTSVSTYKIDDQIEAEISSRLDWDGPALNRVRVYKNVSLDQISDASRVSRTYLNAVEQNDIKALPAPVFVRGFVIQMARILGLDETKVATSYMKIHKEKSQPS